MSEQLKYKLLHFQQKPPKKLWDEIDAALDDQHNSLSKKLYHYKESPSKNNWNKIEEVLINTTKEQTVVKPFFKKHYYKYLTAAVLIIAVSVITFFAVKNDAAPPASDVVVTTPNSEATISEEATPSEAITSNEPSLPPGNSIVNKPSAPRSNTPADKKEIANNTRYTTLADDDGKMVRLSRKIFPVFDCAENSTAFLRKRCQENIESLQRQMASSIVSPSADFAGLLDMLKKLEENN